MFAKKTYTLDMVFCARGSGDVEIKVGYLRNLVVLKTQGTGCKKKLFYYLNILCTYKVYLQIKLYHICTTICIQ